MKYYVCGCKDRHETDGSASFQVPIGQRSRLSYQTNGFRGIKREETDSVEIKNAKNNRRGSLLKW